MITDVNTYGKNPTAVPSDVPKIINKNQECLDKHRTIAKIILMYGLTIIGLMAIPALWCYERRLAIEAIAVLGSGIIGWFLNELKKS